MFTRVTVPVLVALAVALGVGYQRGARPAPVYTTTGTFVALLADDESLLWLEKPKPTSPGAALYSLRTGSAQPTCLYRENRLTEAAVGRQSVFALERTGGTGALLAIPLGGGAPKRLLTGLVHPARLAVADGRVYWTETHPGRFHHVFHVPAVRERVVLRSAPVGGGDARVVAVFEGTAPAFSGELLGMYKGRFYWLDRFGQSGSEGWAAVRRVAVGGGAPERVVLQRSVANQAILYDGTLLFTAPSEDAARPLALRCLQRLDLSTSSPTAETLTDWLPPTGRLVARGGTIYYGSLEGLWRVPITLAPPLSVGKRGFGSPLLVRRDGWLYFVGPTEGGFAIYRAPQTLGTRLSAALSR